MMCSVNLLFQSPSAALSSPKFALEQMLVLLIALMKRRNAEVVLEMAWSKMTSDVSSLKRISVCGTIYSVKSAHTK